MPGAYTYYVYRSTTPGGEGATAIGTSGYTYLNDNGLSNGVTYYYKVAAAYYSDVPGAQSTEVSVVPGSAALPAPLLIGKPLPTSTLLIWTVVPSATFYEVLRYDNNDGWATIGQVTGGSTTTFSDTSATPGVSYEYKVAGGNANGVGQQSYYANASAGDAPMPAPSGAWAVPNGASITLNWNSVPSASGYVIYRGIASGGETARPYQIYNSNATTISIPAVAGVKYFYLVAGFDSSGVGLPSMEAYATGSGALPTAPLLGGYAAVGSIVVRWTAVPGAVGYRLFKDDGFGNMRLYKSYSSSTLAAGDSAVSNGTTYRYAVAATTTNGTGTMGFVTIKAGTGQPNPPAAIVAYPSGSYNGINWRAVPGVSRYNIYRGTAPGTEKLLITGVSNTSANDYAVVAGTRYYYEVKAVLNGSESNFSQEVSALTNSPRLLIGNIGLTLVAGKIQLNIGAVPGATQYEIYRSDDQGSNYFLLQSGVVGSTFTDLTALPKSTYFYEVAAGNADGEGCLSNSVSGTAGATVMTAPKGTIAFAYTSYIQVSCDVRPGANSYNVYRSLTTTMPSTPIAAGVSSSYSDYSAVPGTRYYYAFTASDNDGESPLSPLCSAKEGSPVLAGASLNLNQASATSLLLNWSPVVGASGYDVYRYDNSNNNYLMIRENLAATTVTDTGLTKGSEYSYYVYAVGLNGAGSRSNTVSGVPGSALLPAPFGLMVDASSPGGLYVHFNPTSDYGINYNVYRSTSPGGEGAVPILFNSNYYFTDGGLTPGTTYYYKVTAVDFHGQSLFSNEASAMVNSAQLPATTISTTVVGSTIRIDWTAVAGATNYTLYRYVYGQYGNGAYKLGLTGTSYVDAAVIPGVSYEYWITAVNGTGEGVASNQMVIHP